MRKKKRRIVFYHGNKKLIAISAEETFDGEINATKELLAYENNIAADEITIKFEKEKQPEG